MAVAKQRWPALWDSRCLTLLPLTGHASRVNAEYLAASRPGAPAGELVARAQAQYATGQTVACNPTVEGAKVEDTVLVTRDGLESLTETPGWPVITHTVDGRTIRSPAILIR
jgi:hypothetical protein